MDSSIDSAAESRLPSLSWNAAYEMLRNDYSECTFHKLNERFINSVGQALADDPSRQEEHRLFQEEDEEGLRSGESLNFFSEILAWSLISNGKTLAGIPEHGKQWLEDAFVVPEDVKAALESCRASARSHIAQGRVTVPSELIIDYKSITDDDALRATEEKTQAAVAHALRSGLQRAATVNGTSAADDKSQGSNDDAK
ncbi:hypothetical protein L198_02576 [Cryptococcus wingfieldii CBS 7118]|uniref:Uncharacterized protein n=1 Tax=Cryptococcus wingfieldii CBS 7118 TaxID=1295528 RepID=A0A1E3JLU4_9TREE|nr:hypothetical protein L198_02576 [Cryptococcus wingfieldii CBS 7118]ODO01849.1 hypothetical protein L198_02576 [Cryptococcus wingfieldii CBS 7118]